MTDRISKAVASYDLCGSELGECEVLLRRLAETYPSAEDPEFLADARRIAFSSLPLGLLRFLEQFYRTEFVSTVAVTGLAIDDLKIGLSPSLWSGQQDKLSTLREELYFVLLGSVLGDIFGWSTLQNGRLINNVSPIRGQEHEQSTSGSLALLAWHTEDAFHPYREDYVGLMALRNHDRIPTTVASVDSLQLTARQRQTLSEPRFIFKPDKEHIYWRGDDEPSSDTPHEGVSHDWSEPPPNAVLFGDPRRPYLRIDPTYMRTMAGDAQAEEVLTATTQQLEAALEDIVLAPGTACFIDNYRAIHGRSAFRPKFDGTDRWLKRMVLTRDLRKSRALRADPEKPVLVPTTIADASLPQAALSANKAT